MPSPSAIYKALMKMRKPTPKPMDSPTHVDVAPVIPASKALSRTDPTWPPPKAPPETITLIDKAGNKKTVPTEELLGPGASRSTIVRGSGPGPDPLSKSGGTKFDIKEEGQPAKWYLDEVEKEIITLKATREPIPPNQLEEIAIENVEARLAKGAKRRGPKTVAAKEGKKRRTKAAIVKARETGRVDPILEGKGKTEYPLSPLDVFQETPPSASYLGPVATREFSPQGGPISKGYRKKGDRKQKDQIDDLLAKDRERQIKEIEEVKDAMSGDPLVEALSPKLLKEHVEKSLIPKALSKTAIEAKRVEANNLFYAIKRGLEVAGDTPTQQNIRTQLNAPLATKRQQLRADKAKQASSLKRLENFEEVMKAAVKRSRKENDPSFIQAIIDRMRKHVKGTQGTLNLGAGNQRYLSSPVAHRPPRKIQQIELQQNLIEMLKGIE